jgi:hypothetical protein
LFGSDSAEIAAASARRTRGNVQQRYETQGEVTVAMRDIRGITRRMTQTMLQ